MSVLDTRREGLTPTESRGMLMLIGLALAVPTTPSTTVDLNVNVTRGEAVIAPKAQVFGLTEDFACGSAIADGKSLPVTVVAAYNSAVDRVILYAVAGEAHDTPAAEEDSRAYYASDAAIEDALPASCPPDMYTVCGTVVFARAGADVSQHYDHAVRSFGVAPDTKHVATGADDFGPAGDSAQAAAALGNIVSGHATILNGQTEVTVTAATLGGAYGGKPVVATWAEAPTAATKLWTEWNGDDLELHIQADNTADLDVDFIVDGR